MNNWTPYAIFITGGVLGGFVGALAETLLHHHLENLRERRRKKDELINLCRNWTAAGKPNLLKYADLREADLRGVILQNADLSYADLRKADLRGASLHGADLTGAN